MIDSYKIFQPTIRLDDLNYFGIINKPTQVKIDVDGLEYNVLKGIQESLMKVESILIEIQPGNKFEKEIYEFFETHRFVKKYNEFEEKTKNQIWIRK